ncbi:methyl-accepting chemotaxis protein [Wenxinia marina]|uniref:Methyl-accepting chemotaxis sensory transducer with Pas/Pac sensor n=1 Tax=Wenxinia marina DSM 24838 TaxID=1123501 RepID=A0A0D0NKW6_9RHOB|nr:methyl-accepting chemotaxis protein [Wenxinia marina]KIQ68955.1 methyl-accepting chemotaxis sensory transducer with Pas/Pac sensor [Wenxinia marina DSM 24838]GGL63790.1 hypothetical protein GCM10011392_18170 [Wenxinia marina]
MFLFRNRADAPDTIDNSDAALLSMVDATQAVIHFKPDGTILKANKNFCDALGYREDEIVGRHHSIFVEEAFKDSEHYRDFWTRLQSGEAISDSFPRKTKSGGRIWIQATYAPVRDGNGTIDRVVKVASDVTFRLELVTNLARGLYHLREGDLTHRLPDSDVQEMSKLIRAYNEAADQIGAMVGRVAGIAGRIDDRAASLGTAANNLSNRTETQAATLEQTAAAVHELTSGASTAARTARDVTDAARETRKAAEGSDELVRKVTMAMDQIKTSSEKISQIVKVIDDIAFQTNLLALNAGVEAARAGEAGRGFAVVASEVRGLAQRSSESAREIKGLIDESAGHVTQGVDLVAEASSELNRIFKGVGAISDRVGEVSATLTEQSTTLAEINAAIGELDSVTQNNAAMVQDTAQTSQLLNDDSGALADEVRRFKFHPAAQSDNAALPQRLAS